MRVVQFVQVIVLLGLIGYAVLVSLENPLLLRLPLPFYGRELMLPAGLALGLALLTGGLYAAFLILPRTLRLALRQRRDLIRRREAEHQLQATLQAVLDGPPSWAQATPAEPLPEVAPTVAPEAAQVSA